MKKLILIDDHKMLRKGISSYITENSDWNIFAEAESIEEIPAIIKKFGDEKEDQIVAVVDIQIKGNDENTFRGFEAVRLFSKAGIPSVIFSSHDTGALIERAMSSDVGARGFVSKLSDEKMLLDAINTVAAGKTFVQPDLVSAFMEVHSLFSVLTKRELQVVKLIQDGLPNEEIAAKLEIKLSTLENYISVIYDKIGCRDRNSLLEKLK
ncbi:MAG: response regulator transcription factor [Spirochaetales bacterium]|nr:response regulator transcription factor [Spirochaetales bacterium]